MLNKFSLILFLCGILSGCTTQAIVSKPDVDTTKRAASFEVGRDRSKVYFINGKMVGNLFNMKHKYPSDFIINGKIIGSMNKDDVMVMELRPGNYELSWNVRSTDLINKKSVPQLININIKGGEIIILQGDYSLGGASMFGLIGSMVSSPKAFLSKGDRPDIQGKNVVTPQYCVPSMFLN